MSDHKQSCNLCLEHRFCRTIHIETPYGGGFIPMCFDCRVNWRDDENACLATTLEHAPTPAFYGRGG